MPRYFDTMLEDIILGKEYPRGKTELYYDEEGHERRRDIAPEYLNSEDKRDARREASSRESDYLNYQLGSSYKLKKGGARPPSGSYALARYPGLRNVAEASAGGMWLPGQLVYSYFKMDPEQQRALLAKQKAWGIEQKRILGW